MDCRDLVTIAKYGDPQEASMAKAFLESQGILGVAVGGELGNTLWHVGPTISVELQVAADDAERATEILDSHNESKSNSRPHLDWICPQCGEEVDAEFEVCWSCGTPFDQTVESADTSAPSNAENAEPEPPSPLFEREQPSKKLEVSDEFGEEENPFSETDERVKRAFRMAVLSALFIPVLPFALYELVQLGSEDLSPRATRKYYQAVIILLIMMAAYLFAYFGFNEYWR